ncbi:MAG: hypothetical protein ACXW0L_04825 [Methylosarcina sp.]
MKSHRILLITLLLIVCACSISTDKDTGKPSARRVIHADVVALDQDIVFNRFGSHDPYGMIYALRRDVISRDGGEQLTAGHVQLRSDKRPRPLVLRANEGDILEVTFTNLISPQSPPQNSGDQGSEVEGQQIPQADVDRLNANNPCAAKNPGSLDSPRTRCAAIALSGVIPLADPHDGKATGLEGIAPGQSITYRWRIDKKGSYLFSSLSAPSGGQGDGGSLVHGLFGTLNVESKGSSWYRSAVSGKDFKLAQSQAVAPAVINYEAQNKNGNPVLNLLKNLGNNRFELIHSPLDAIIVESGGKSFREFSVVFHDELKTVYRPEFDILSPAQGDKSLKPYADQLAGVRDGFAINYGSSGMGSILLANRLGKGPAKNCVDCQYEEFFLQSWVNGDPALLASYDDDPSNVHHSYLNDPVRINNSHAGPKETHVFHLHAHQWESSTSGHANYLDSQTIGPQQSFSYNISHEGSGNLNQTPGDSIFHCHLYPHFAQGMWGLWRVHDVFEDGSRRLPDGGGLPGSPDEHLAGMGTDPLTGQNHGGTPIPAIVPLPHLAMPLKPTYGKNSFPGFPFYISGKQGHRAPQPPIDMVEDGGLGRHIVTAGKRSFNGGNSALDQVKSADMTLKITSAQLELLPPEGTSLERNAMRFHGTAKHASKTPEGIAKDFLANGKAPQPGAPFSDPCGKNKGGKDVPFSTRRYRASAIDLDIQTNEHKWHDPQSRINVLDDEVALFEHGRSVKDAEPFFFRAESEECVEFLHTNRAHEVLKRDSFQVATPTDIIGQHIHLVKFDVTASDGSGNGFNYEDGTMSWEAIDMLTKASRAKDGAVVDSHGKIVSKPLAAKTDKRGKPVYQTTIQRWWVDPYFHEKGFDAGLGTVFTHDHFAPSSIQQHGFYNALLVEPKGSRWLSASGRNLKDDDRSCDTLEIDGLPDKYSPPACTDSHAVGSRAQIVETPNREDTREFALAIADFALLYDGTRKNSVHVPHLMEKFAGDYKKIADKEGFPVDPPNRPEAISTDHHNPYLINYKHEPIPLRIADRDSNGDFSKLKPSSCDTHITNNGKLCSPGDPAYVFSSLAPNGDPFLPPLRAYEGDRVLVRLIQGAQEVQHSFSIHGLNWQREGNNPQAPWVNAQEIGISEHFELRALNLDNTPQNHVDRLFHVGSQDGLWNGAWGLLRVFNGKQGDNGKNIDPGSCLDEKGNPSGKSCQGIAETRANCSLSDDRFDRCHLAPLPSRQEGKVLAPNPASGGPGGGCPTELFNERDLVEFKVEAWQLKDLFEDKEVKMHYDRQSNVYDPDALIFIQQKDREKLQQDIKDLNVLRQYQQGQKAVEPLVLRAEAGKCLVVNLTNKFKLAPTQAPSDDDGDALMPKITSLNVDKGQSDYKTVPPSNRVSLHPQLVSYEADIGDGVMVGLNQRDAAQADNLYARPNTSVTYNWYAGTVKLLEGNEERYQLEPFKNGAVAALTSADVIGQGSHGLIGALVIEPPGATISEDSDSHLSARISYNDNGKPKHFHEFVVLYQDGLNLHQNGKIIPDCAVCDDSYDLGEHAINYRSAAFWQRLGLSTNPQSLNGEKPQGFNLNQVAFPPDFFDPSYRPLPFNDFVANAGEELHFHVVYPTGRARQRSFQLYGHSFKPSIEGYGSPWSMLMAPGKAETLVVEKAIPGSWLFRDGPAHIFANGAWGRLDVE